MLRMVKTCLKPKLMIAYTAFKVPWALGCGVNFFKGEVALIIYVYRNVKLA